MMRDDEEWTVGELARRAGVSVRTLHHFDAIGLLRPALVLSNGYRLYRKNEALRLQEILFYRAAGMQLAEIGRLLNGGTRRLERLVRHRQALIARRAETDAMIATLDATIAHLEKEKVMAIDELYKPFAPALQAEYEAWLTDTYGGDMAAKIAVSKVAVAKEGGGEALAAALAPIEAALVAHYEAGEASEDAAAHDDLEAHRAFVARAWGRSCDPQAYRGLGELYRAHADFVARYERLSRGFSAWLPAAMAAHAARLETRGGR